MKNLTYYPLILFFLASLLQIACSGKEKETTTTNRENLLSPVKIEIPDAIKSDADLTALVKESETALNKFSDNMEVLIEELAPYKGTEAEELGTFEKMKVAKIAMEFMAKNTEGIAILQKLSNYAEKRASENKPLTDEQMKAMAVIYDAFEKRMKEIGEKYEGFGGQK